MNLRVSLPRTHLSSVTGIPPLGFSFVTRQILYTTLKYTVCEAQVSPPTRFGTRSGVSLSLRLCGRFFLEEEVLETPS